MTRSKFENKFSNTVLWLLPQKAERKFATANLPQFPKRKEAFAKAKAMVIFMKQSVHTYTDERGYRCAVEIIDETDDLVVFDSAPKLSFDLMAYKLRIARSEFYDYHLTYRLRDGRLYFCSLQTKPAFFSRKTPVLGVMPKKLGDGKWVEYRFDDLPTDYTGRLDVGKDFDMRYMPNDDKVRPVPFCPEVYKKNGYILIKNGKITESFLK